MTPTNYSPTNSRLISVATRMLVGAGIGLVVISFFVFSADNPNPAWGKFWMIRPLVLVPIAGAMGGLCQHFLVHFRQRIGISKTVALILGALVFITAIWMGIVLGLDGTMWD